MPTYEYQCTSCGCRFELRRGFTDNSPVSCPKCHNDTRLLFSPVPIVFKGPGFYVTDSAMEGKNKPQHKIKSEEDTTKAKEHEPKDSEQVSKVVA